MMRKFRDKRGGAAMSTLLTTAGIITVIYSSYFLFAMIGIIKNGVTAPATVIEIKDVESRTFTGQQKKEIVLMYRDDRREKHTINKVVKLGESRHYKIGSEHNVVFDAKNTKSYRFGERPEDFNTNQEAISMILGIGLIIMGVFAFGHSEKG